MTTLGSVSFPRPAFIESLGFEPDQFQLNAFDAIDDDRNVIVSAPTGAGKTLVASYAVAKAVSDGYRVFYTTPIKALSNQKYQELVDELGVDNVGLLTGDHVVNGDAPAVVMTTEVLRNMLYAGSSLGDLAFVVLDEVHYLQDAYRGPVWEEVIIHLPRSVGLVCLSATVSNADELSEWIETVRGPTTLVTETRRPVALDNLYFVGEKKSPQLHSVTTLVRGRPNHKGPRFDRDASRRTSQRRGRQKRRPWTTPSAIDVILQLEKDAMLPVIYFIFSRAGCDDAAANVVDSGLMLTTEPERQEIERIFRARTAGLTPADADVLRADEFLQNLEHGVASHHAGLIPPFKEVVEQCFSQGLVKVVFATETLALGINMPARSVVISRLTKFTGERHEFLTASQYTQLTGRAGRRGIDTRGYAAVLWSPYVKFEQVAELAMSKNFVLRSSFRPTYNMAANLVRRCEPERARELLNMSFAQFRADATVVRSERHYRRLRDRRVKLLHQIEADYGPIEQIRAAVVLAGDGGDTRDDIAAALATMVPGEVVRFDTVDGPLTGVVVAVSLRKRNKVKATVVDAETMSYSLRPSDLLASPIVVGKTTLPKPYLPNSTSFQYDVAQQLVQMDVSTTNSTKVNRDDLSVFTDGVPPKAHRSLQRLARVEQDLERIDNATNRRARSLAAQFDSVVALLEQRGYVNVWELSDAGQRLARCYHECDLLLIDSLEAGLFDGLTSVEFAGLVSVFVYNSRRREQGSVWIPNTKLKRRFAQIEGLAVRLAIDEDAAGLQRTRKLDAGFVAVAHGWASGGDIDDVLRDEEIPAGDFIRTIKQLTDVLSQLGSLAAEPATARAARQAVDLLYRDLVSASSAAVQEAQSETDPPSDDD